MTNTGTTTCSAVLQIVDLDCDYANSLNSNILLATGNAIKS
jgi:hypothetical protein